MSAKRVLRLLNSQSDSLLLFLMPNTLRLALGSDITAQKMER